jgi:hypothetical protein
MRIVVDTNVFVSAALKELQGAPVPSSPSDVATRRSSLLARVQRGTSFARSGR